MKIKKKKVFKYVRYLRKSTEEPDSVSIRNQNDVTRVLIENIIKKDTENDYIEVGVFSDENYSGTDSDRPDFQSLLKLVRTKEINMIIVTDLSRLSRNTAESINYIQGLFVTNDVRFVSYQLPTLDTYLEPDRIYSIEIPMQSIMNENHCAETSSKVKRSLHRMKEDGKFVGSFASYGWKKDPKDKHKLLLDEEPVEVLRLMRDMLFEGKTTVQIARALNDRGILNRAGYKASKGLNYKCSEKNISYLWSSSTIRHVMLRPENAGDLIQSRQKVLSYKIHKKVDIPEDEWIVIKDAIPAIYTRDELEKIKSIINKRVVVNKKENAPHLFSGFLECGDCQSSLTFKKNTNRSGGTYCYYVCNKYRKFNKASGCSSHSIREDFLKEIVLKSIQKQIEVACNIQEVLNTVDKQIIVNRQTETVRKSITRVDEEIAKVRNIKLGLYEDYKEEIITREEFMDLKLSYTDQEQDLNNKKELLVIELERIEQMHYEHGQYIDEFVRFQNIKELTRDVLTHLVSKILIFDNDEITIQFKFRDEYENYLEILSDKEIQKKYSINPDF